MGEVIQGPWPNHDREVNHDLAVEARRQKEQREIRLLKNRLMAQQEQWVDWQ